MAGTSLSVLRFNRLVEKPITVNALDRWKQRKIRLAGSSERRLAFLRHSIRYQHREQRREKYFFYPRVFFGGLLKKKDGVPSIGGDKPGSEKILGMRFEWDLDREHDELQKTNPSTAPVKPVKI